VLIVAVWISALVFFIRVNIQEKGETTGVEGQPA